VRENLLKKEKPAVVQTVNDIPLSEMTPHSVGKGGCQLIVRNWFQGEEKEFDLSSKDLTLVVFWSPSCGTCQDEIPKLQPLYDKYRSKGFNILAISDDDEDTEEAARQFVTDHSLDFSFATADFHEKDFPYQKMFGDFKGVPAAALMTMCKKQWKGWGFSLSELEKTLETRFKDL